MEVRIRHGKETQAEAFARFHRVVCDRSFDEGGGDNGMTSPELMLSAIGCCSMECATAYLRARKLPPAGISMRVFAAEGGEPRRLMDIGIEIDAPGLSGRAREGLIKAIEGGLLQQTLAAPPKVYITMATVVTESPRVKQPANLAS